MRKKQYLWGGIIYIIFVLTTLINGCKNYNFENEWQWSKDKFGGPPNCSPKEYVPIEPGNAWTYEIIITDRPIQHAITNWRVNGEQLFYDSRRLFKGNKNFPNKKEFLLKMCVADEAQKENEQFLSSRLKILQDDLGVFRDAQNIFYVIAKESPFQFYLGASYSMDSSMAPSDILFKTTKNQLGVSLSGLFFASEPRTFLKEGKYSEAIYFIGPIHTPDTEYPVLRFKKTMEMKLSEEEKDLKKSPVYKDLVEELFFTKGIGLTKLVQFCGDKKTMEWNLVDFQK